MLFTKVAFKGKEIKNERLELTDKGSLYFFHLDVTLSGCTLVIKVPARNILIHGGARFIDCAFEVKQELKNHQQWVFASLKGCRFKGALSGCDFGHWPGYAPGWEHGSIEDCDFTEARLNACRFMGCDPATLRLPRWPCFTFLNPIQRASELRDARWPDLFGRIVVNDLHTEPPTTVATTYHAPTIAKQMETTPEELRAVIEKFDCIFY